MRALVQFTKTTLIGGLLVILPIYVCILLLAKAVKGLLDLLGPVAGALPASVEWRQAAAIIVLVLICFVLGLVPHLPRPARQERGRAGGAGKSAGLHVLSRLGQTADRQQRRGAVGAGAGRDRGRAGSRPHRREAGRRILHRSRALGADADGGQHLHPAGGPGASLRHSFHHGDRRVLEVGDGRRRVRADDEGAREAA